MGLSLPLDKFSFHYADEQTVGLTIHHELGDDSARWQFWQFRPAPEYLVAICAEKVSEQPPRLTVRQAIPMVTDKECAFEFQRVSGIERQNH
jgi:4'-phosphopantetheinyl transferase